MQTIETSRMVKLVSKIPRVDSSQNKHKAGIGGNDLPCNYCLIAHCVYTTRMSITKLLDLVVSSLCKSGLVRRTTAELGNKV